MANKLDEIIRHSLKRRRRRRRWYLRTAPSTPTTLSRPFVHTTDAGICATTRPEKFKGENFCLRASFISLII